MSEQTDKLVALLLPYGLEPEEARVYLFLVENGLQTALSISRKIKMGRTKVYRILDKLYAKGMVNRKIDDMGFKFVANSVKQLEMLVTQRQQEVESLKKNTSMVMDELAQLAAQYHPTSKVLYYTGVDGLKQVTINSLQAKERLFIYETSQDMSSFIDQDFAEKLRKEFVENRIFTYQLTNWKKIHSYTAVKELVRHFWECRYIDREELDMEFEILIYNDVYAMYNTQGSEIFCVEIHNPQLASMQKQLFQFMWTHARRMKIVSDTGEAVLERP